MMIAGLVVVVVVGVRRGRRSVHACLHAVGDVDALMASVAEMVEIVVAVVMAVGRGFQAGGAGCGDFVGGAVECLLVGEMCRRGRCGLLLLLLLVGCRRWEFVIRWAQAALGLLCLLFSDSLSALLGGLEV